MGFLDFFRIKREDGDKTKRITVTVPEATNDALKALAADLNITKSQATKDLIVKGMTVEALSQKGGEIIYRAPEGKEISLYRKPIDKISDPLLAFETITQETDHPTLANGKAAEEMDEEELTLTEVEIIDDIAAF
ncbi:MAG: hypothetical protein AAFZ17_12645 [Cyanobacteria bacterium J06650_10]